MKNYLTIFVLVVLVVIGTTSCTFVSKYRLKQVVKESNRECPMEVEDIGTLTSIRYDESSNMVVFNYTFSADNKELFKLLQSDTALAKSMIRVDYSDNDTDIQNILELVVDAECGIREVYTCRGQEISAELSNTECRELLNNPPSEQERNRLTLQLVVSAMRAACPEDLGDGMVITSVYDNGTDVIIYIEVPDYMIDALDDLSYYELKASLREEMQTEDMKEIVETCIANNRGFVYHYVGRSSYKKLDVRLSPEDLRSL